MKKIQITSGDVFDSHCILTTDQRPTNDRRPTDLSLGKFGMAIYPQWVIRFTSCLVLGRVFGVGGSNGAIKSKMMAARMEEDLFRMGG